MNREGRKETVKFGRPISKTVAATYDRRRAGFDPYAPDQTPERNPLARALTSHWRFLLAAFLKRAQTGALFPSQRFLIDRMLLPVEPDYAGEIIELGPGTGALTFRLAAKCPKARVVACEINPDLAHDLEERVTLADLTRSVSVVCDSAEHFLASIRRKGAGFPDFIISGIPLGNLERSLVHRLVGSIHATLPQGGMYIQFQYTTMDRKKIRDRFARMRTVPVLLNVPPAVVYYAQK
jgi:phospholipid N-methyltransferase